MRPRYEDPPRPGGDRLLARCRLRARPRGLDRLCPRRALVVAARDERAEAGARSRGRPPARAGAGRRCRGADARAVSDLRVDGLEVDGRVVVGSPAREICRQAEVLDVDLVVVGTRGQGGVGRLLLGSTAERVVQHCRRPVVTVHPHDAGEERLQTVLLPTDFSAGAEAAAEAAVEVFALGGRRRGSVLLHAWQVPVEVAVGDFGGGRSCDARSAQRSAGGRGRSSRRLPAGSSGSAVAVDVRLCEGDPGPTIVAEAAALGGRRHRARHPRPHRLVAPVAGQHRRVGGAPRRMPGAHPAAAWRKWRRTGLIRRYACLGPGEVNGLPRRRGRPEIARLSAQRPSMRTRRAWAAQEMHGIVVAHRLLDERGRPLGRATPPAPGRARADPPRCWPGSARSGGRAAPTRCGRRRRPCSDETAGRAAPRWPRPRTRHGAAAASLARRGRGALSIRRRASTQAKSTSTARTRRRRKGLRHGAEPRRARRALHRGRQAVVGEVEARQRTGEVAAAGAQPRVQGRRPGDLRSRALVEGRRG